MSDLERELREMFRRREADLREPVFLPDRAPRELLRRTRHRQVANVVLGLVTAAAVAVASIAGASALLRSAERRTPLEPPPSFSPGALEAAPIGTYAFLDLTVASDGAVWWTGPGITRFDPASGSLRTFTVADAPAFDGITLMAPARDGGVWTSWNGPTRFDGARFRETLPQTAVISYIAEGPDGTVWGENGGDVFRLSGDVWMPVFSKGLPSERPEVSGGTNTSGGLPLGDDFPIMTVDASGGLWVSFWQGFTDRTGLGVSRFDGTTWTTWTTSDGLPSDNVIAIAPASNGDVWIGTDDGAARFRNGSWTAYPGAVTGIGGVWSIAPTEEGVVVGGRSRFARFDGTTWSPVTAQDGLDGGGGRLAAGPGGVWAATSAGLFRLEGSRWKLEVASEGPLLMPWEGVPVAAVSSEDVWTAEHTSVWRLERGTWTEYSDLPGGYVSEIAVAPDGVPWVSTEHGLARFDGSAWEQVEPGPHDAIAFAPDGTVWTANNDAWTVGPVGGPVLPALPNEPAESTGGTLDLAVGPRDDVWVGWTKGGGFSVEDAGLVRFEGGEWQTVAPYADRYVVRDLEATPEGDVWVSGSTLDRWAPPFLARFRNGAWTTFIKADGISGGPGQLDVTPSDEVLFATSEGLLVFRDEAWHLLQKGWFSLSVAPDGTVWLGGDGVFRLSDS